MKLCDLVEIIENNIECVVLKVKDDVRLDLIKLGYFTGNEDIIRLTKGNNHGCSVFEKDGKNSNWEWGTSGETLVSELTRIKGNLIEQCITDDFDIYIGKNKEKIKETLYIKSLKDVENAQHIIKFMYWDKNSSDISVHKDGEFYKFFKNLREGKTHFENLGYELNSLNKYIASTGCIVEEFAIEKIKENEVVYE